MTTLEEIGECPIANWKFWSDSARMNLAFMRYQGASDADRRLERAAFRRKMWHRRNRTYLEIEQ